MKNAHVLAISGFVLIAIYFDVPLRIMMFRTLLMLPAFIWLGFLALFVFAVVNGQ